MIMGVKRSNIDKNKWTFKIYSGQIADTGEYTGYIQFTNGNLVLQTEGEDMTDCDCASFCALLDLMPDLWNDNLANVYFDLQRTKEKLDHCKQVLASISESGFVEGLTNDEKVRDLQAKAFNALYEVINFM